MSLQLSAMVAGPLTKLFGSKFKAPNFQFPAGHDGPSITFTPQLNPGSSYVKNTPIQDIGFVFGQGNIRFYLPQQIEMNYGANYQETDMSLILKNAFSGEGDLEKRIMNAGKAALTSGVKNAASALDGVSGSTFAAYGQFAAGVAFNNHMEVMFQGVNFREFNFSFKFFPRNHVESRGLKSAIDLFKYHMHPNFMAGSANAMFDVPSKFSINISGDNGFYGGFCEAVLVGMNINGSGSGVAAQFEDGSPAEIDLTLNFKETSYLTKERLDGAMPF